MPQYELMYLLGSHVADDEVPKISEQIRKFAEDLGATDIQETQLGKKKLAYPIKKTRNGHYVVVNFSMDGTKVNSFDARIRAQDTVIIRYILINLDEHFERLEKDKVVQAKLNRKIPPVEGAAPTAIAAGSPVVLEAPVKKEALAKKEKKEEAPTIDLSEDIDERIEKALSEDLTK